MRRWSTHSVIRRHCSLLLLLLLLLSRVSRSALSNIRLIHVVSGWRYWWNWFQLIGRWSSKALSWWSCCIAFPDSYPFCVIIIVSQQVIPSF